MANEIFDSAFDNVEYGTERTTQSTISISPAITDQYEESVSENMEDVYIKIKMRDELDDMYKNSEFYKKYGSEKIDKCGMSDIYYYFKGKFLEMNEYNLVQIFCTIAEYFEMNYKVLYNDIISLEDKVELLDRLSEQFGLKKEFSKPQRLF